MRTKRYNSRYDVRMGSSCPNKNKRNICGNQNLFAIQFLELFEHKPKIVQTLRRIIMRNREICALSESWICFVSDSRSVLEHNSFREGNFFGFHVALE